MSTTLVTSAIQRVVLVLIKPTHYGDDDFPYRFWRAVLPSNSLAVLNTLSRGGVKTELHVFEDGVTSHNKRLKKLYRRFPEEGTKLIIAFVAVQTAQFPRAVDLISEWQKVGATCVIGGFHVSGVLATMLVGIEDPKPGEIHGPTREKIPCPHIMPPEIIDLLRRGVIVFSGEAEDKWDDALREIIVGQPQQIYWGGRPALDTAPVPSYPAGYFENSFATPIGTFDTGRGCPFACSFCVIINVQGRTQRYRPPEAIIEEVKAACVAEKMKNDRWRHDPKYQGRASFFFTDDNFVRNPLWEEILDRLIALRQEGYQISFMVESDLLCYTVKGKDHRPFLEKLAAAGCGQIFMGVESMNSANLKEAHKWQNNVNNYKRCWEDCHKYEIVVHGGYIIGFNHDTPETIRADIGKLFETGCDQVSYFMLTPLPGSEDHIRAYMKGIPMDADLSKYDSFHAVWDHPGGLMTRPEWFKAYQDAWSWFYTTRNMIGALKRFKSRARRLDLVRNYLWYRWSFSTERTHPMIAGFYRQRRYRDRRPGAPPLSRLRFWGQEIWRHLRYVGRFLAEFYIFQHVIFETEFAPYIAEREEWFSGQVSGSWNKTRLWAELTFGRVMTRRWLNRFWIEYGRQKWYLLLKPWWHVKMLPYALTEVIYSIRALPLMRSFISETFN